VIEKQSRKDRFAEEDALLGVLDKHILSLPAKERVAYYDSLKKFTESAPSVSYIKARLEHSKQYFGEQSYLTPVVATPVETESAGKGQGEKADLSEYSRKTASGEIPTASEKAAAVNHIAEKMARGERNFTPEEDEMLANETAAIKEKARDIISAIRAPEPDYTNEPVIKAALDKPLTDEYTKNPSVPVDTYPAWRQAQQDEAMKGFPKTKEAETEKPSLGKLTITADETQQLYDLGYTKDDVYKMKSTDATAIIASGKTADKPFRS